MFGLGMTQVSPVSTKVCFRSQPVTSRTVRSDSRAPTSACRNSPSKKRASSPTVIPCCWTISFLPTPEVKPDSSIHRLVHRPDVGVEPGADVLDVEDNRLDVGGAIKVSQLGSGGSVGVVD